MTEPVHGEFRQCETVAGPVSDTPFLKCGSDAVRMAESNR